ncbi:MAG: hypothetical protein WC554_01935 [Clostridia bacterium]
MKRGKKIINDNYTKDVEKNKRPHRSNAEIAEKNSRKQLIEKLYNQELNNKVGISTQYDPIYAQQVYYLALLGATIQMIAMHFNVDEQTINKWGRENPAFAESIKRGGVDFDMKVAERMGQRALGYDYEESESWQVLNKKTGEITTLHKHYNKHMAPDVTAQIFWLKNRQRGIWTDVSRTEMYSKVDIDIKKKIDLSILDQVEVDSVKQIAIAMLSKQQGSLEKDNK